MFSASVVFESRTCEMSMVHSELVSVAASSSCSEFIAL